MTSAIRQRVATAKAGLKGKTKPSGWVLPQEKGALGDEGTW
jgi:NCS1 family nucleobase:cation symporter-1